MGEITSPPIYTINFYLCAYDIESILTVNHKANTYRSHFYFSTPNLPEQHHKLKTESSA